MQNPVPSPSTPDADVLVIGAGLSGLNAAHTLQARGVKVTVLEARDRVGGRTWSRPFGKGMIDLGGQWIGPTQHRLTHLARELGVETFPQYDQGNHLLEVGGQIRPWQGSIPKLPLHNLLELQATLWTLDRLMREVPRDRPFAAPRARAWDAISVEAWADRHLLTGTGRELLSATVRSIFCVEPREMSFLYFLFYLHAGGGILKLADVKGGAQQDRFVLGAQELSKRLAARLERGVVLSAPVRALVQERDGVTAHTDGGTFRGRFAILALPPALAGRIDYQPGLPARRDHLTQRMPMGSTIKCIALYETPFWRRRGFSGQLVSNRGPVHLAFDDSPADGSEGALVAFILGDEARRWSGQPVEVRRQAVLEDFARFLGPEALAAVDYVDQDWNADPWTRGCPVGIMPTGAMTATGAALREPVGRLHWAGTETATAWAGYMDGALEAGERAALEVHTRLRA